MAKKIKYRQKVSDIEIDFMRKHVDDMTDKQIANELKGSVSWVRKVRKENNIKKQRTKEDIMAGLKSGDMRVINEKMEDGDLTVINDIVTSGMDKDLLQRQFETLFKNSGQYRLLKEIFTADELEYYLKEFSMHITEIRAMGETINASEMRALDTLIQTRIRMNRLVLDEKSTRLEIDECKREKLLAEEDKKCLLDARIFQLTKSCENVNRDWTSLNKQSLDIQKILDVTREERVKRHDSSKEGILQLVATMQDRKKRDRLESQAAAYKESTKRLADKWKKTGYMLDHENIEEITKGD